MEKYFYAKGRRKTSVATVRLYAGEGVSTINDKPAEQVYHLSMDKKKMLSPLSLTENLKKYYFTAQTMGGGIIGQRDALIHGLSRALVKADIANKSVLKKSGLLTRDDRKKERKKTGLLKARKSPQFSKR